MFLFYVEKKSSPNVIPIKTVCFCNLPKHFFASLVDHLGNSNCLVLLFSVVLTYVLAQEIFMIDLLNFFICSNGPGFSELCNKSLHHRQSLHHIYCSFFHA